MEHGRIKVKLNELLERKGVSKNKLSKIADMQRTQIRRYCNGAVTRFDADVLVRICTALECELGDLLEFVPPGKVDDH